MMDFSRTKQEQEQFDSVKEFAANNLNHNIVEADKLCEFNTDSWRECARFGVLNWVAPSEFGGTSMSIAEAAYLMEALGEGCQDNGLAFALGAQMWAVQKLLAEHGSQEQLTHWMPKLLSGELHASFAITEENSGSDAFALKTTAESHGDGYVINGQKKMVTMAPIADCIIVFAVTDPAAKQWGLSAFVVDANNAGIKRLANDAKMGLRTVPFGSIHFNDCHIPANALLGKVGAGASLFSKAQSWERSLVLAPQVGAMQRLLNDCVREASTKQRGGQSIGKHQAVSHRIANMQIRLEASRLLLYKTAWLLDTNQQSVMNASITKTFLGEAFVETCHDALAIHGGAGYMIQTGIERHLRDAIGATLYGGTVDIQRNIIANMLGT